MKAHYAFKEQVAMVDFTYNEGKTSDAPLAKVCLFCSTKALFSLCATMPFCPELRVIAFIMKPAAHVLGMSCCCCPGAWYIVFNVNAGLHQGWCW